MPADFHNYPSKIHKAVKRVDLDATHAMREAANARQGKFYAHGLELVIEWPKGSNRQGVGADGKSWTRKMFHHYGRINRTLGVDCDPVDVYIGDHPETQIVFVVSQLDKEGNLDEHKVMLGFRNVTEARKAYLSHYPDNWDRTRLGEIRAYTMPQFREWLDSMMPTKKPTKIVGKRAFQLLELLV
jgi:Inorganic Pyrophosphatase